MKLLCYRCKKRKDASEFYPDITRKSGRSSKCKLCAVICSREYTLMRNFGITTREYNLMFLEQQGQCKICNRHQSELPKKLHVDYNADTGTVRGLLCGNCIRGLASLGDVLLEAIIYLEG